MSRYSLVSDISQYQPSDITFFREIRDIGVKSVIIKLTQGSRDGDAYVNPKFTTQLKNARAAGLHVHAYHYARFISAPDAREEADWFVDNLRAHHVSPRAVCVVDIEDSCLPKRFLTHDIKTFTRRVRERGYHHTDIYAMASWFWNGRLNRNRFSRYNLWIANYGTSQPGVPNVGTWQFTDNFQGLAIDCSRDFHGYYTKERR